jgi:hypothetical protein
VTFRDRHAVFPSTGDIGVARVTTDALGVVSRAGARRAARFVDVLGGSPRASSLVPALARLGERRRVLSRG